MFTKYIRLIVLFALLASFFQVPSAQAATDNLYVSQSGCNGVTPCYQTIQEAIDASVDGQSILIAGGKYYYQENFAESIVIQNKIISLQGGFDPASWVKDPYLETKISGDGQHSNVTLSQSTVSLMNLTIQDGQAANGGGMLAWKSTVTITDSIFADNTATIAGGGIYADESEINVFGTGFAGNDAERGGGLFLQNTHVIVGGSWFVVNKAAVGGGVLVFNSQLTMENTVFDSNQATSVGGALYVDGQFTMRSSLIHHNSAGDKGGGLYLYGGTDGRIEVNLTTFVFNYAATAGGAIFTDGGQTTISRSEFKVNDGGVGGAIFNQNGELSAMYTYLKDEAYVFGASQKTTMVNCMLENAKTVIDGGQLTISNTVNVSNTLTVQSGEPRLGPNLWWDSNFPEGIGQIVADPQLDSDNHPQQDSPVIDAGQENGETVDAAGHPIVGLPDLGIFEYKGPGLAVSPESLELAAGENVTVTASIAITNTAYQGFMVVSVSDKNGWVTATQVELPAGQSVEIEISASTQGMAPGDVITDTIYIQSGDIMIEVPVTLTRVHTVYLPLIIKR